jgi:glycerol-3-phosphate acyltransferase PlsX
MNGSAAPEAAIEAGAWVSRHTSIQVILVGSGDQAGPWLRRTSYNAERLVLQEPGSGESSLSATVRIVADGQADALVTAAHPPLVLSCCHQLLKAVEGLTSAPLAAVCPTAPRPGNRDPFALILDVGAHLNPTAQDLVSWAKMGTVYAGKISKVDAPTVALLSTGRGATDGPEAVQQAHLTLKQDTSIRFVGNIESVDIPSGAADVIVCDGYVGQAVVGLLGGIGDALLTAARGAYEKHFTWRMGMRLLEGAVVRFKEVIEHAGYGGTPLLGFNKVAILALEESGAKALSNAIKLAAKSVREQVPEIVAQAIAPSP